MSEQGYPPLPLRHAVADHIGGGTPSRQVPSYWRGHIPWASVKDFPEQSGVIDDTEEHISGAGLNASASNLIPAGIPLVCTRMAVGRAAMPSVPMAINQDVKALFPATGVSSTYLLKVLQFIQPKAEAQAVGSTVKGIRIQDYLNIEAPMADPIEQPVIARVLGTLDTAIFDTEAIIAKLKAVKRGLLHDLLTRGIDVNGELRPPQAEAPHLYKESPLGWIPREWDCTRLAYVADTYAGGTPSRDVPGFYGGDVPWVKSAEVNQESVSSTAERITQFGLRNSSAKWVPAGTPLIAMYGATAGVVSWLAVHATTNQAVLAVVPKAGLCGRWVYWALIWSASRLLASVQGSGQPNLSKSTIDALTMAVPHHSEQELIANTLNQQASRLAEEVKYLAKIRVQKIGLMDDLLTGRVRVTALLSETEPRTECA
ncbi:restriction endonuclease subunit S [Luteimonas mephitis]|uniref:restriction endonuclease subunit S n=1 Tax=Luteimonas mephitis TaxID=83615 RepID=UPI003A9269B7